jgi:hypothetical protein
MTARSYPALVLVDGANLALNRLPSNPPGQNIGDKRSTVTQLFGPALTFLSHLRRVDVSETDHADACHLECITVHWSYRTGDCLRQCRPRYESGHAGYGHREPSDHPVVLPDRVCLDSLPVTGDQSGQNRARTWPPWITAASATPSASALP